MSVAQIKAARRRIKVLQQEGHFRKKRSKMFYKKRDQAKALKAQKIAAGKRKGK